MTLTGVRAGDVVKVDKRGHIFFAEVTDKPERGEVAIRPISRATYYTAEAAEVIGHYKLMGRPRLGHKVSG